MTLRIFFLVLISLVINAQEAPAFEGIKTVILDAGHGGRDPGNLGTRRYKTVEKDITLAVTLKVGAYLKEYLPEVKIVYTRATDQSVTLERRAEIANEAGGDLFISIHCDSYEKSSVHGSTSIVLGKNHGDENRIALQENAAILLEDDYQSRYDGFDPTDPQSTIGINLMQQTYLNESVELASMIQEQFRERVQRRDRGVKQQPLYVTSRTAMPAVLVELGFLTNPEEEDFLNTERGQSYMASAIFRAIRDFKQRQDVLMEDAINKQKFSDNRPEAPVEEKAEEQVAETSSTPSTKLKQEEPIKKASPTPPAKKESQKLQDPKGLGYAVQILTLSFKKPLDDGVFKGEQNIGMIEEGGLFKYYSSFTTDYQKAQNEAQRLRQKGFKGAFVIGLDQGRKISAVEARKKLR